MTLKSTVSEFLENLLKRLHADGTPIALRPETDLRNDLGLTNARIANLTPDVNSQFSTAFSAADLVKARTFEDLVDLIHAAAQAGLAT